MEARRPQESGPEPKRARRPQFTHTHQGGGWEAWPGVGAQEAPPRTQLLFLLPTRNPHGPTQIPSVRMVKGDSPGRRAENWPPRDVMRKQSVKKPMPRTKSLRARQSGSARLVTRCLLHPPRPGAGAMIKKKGISSSVQGAPTDNEESQP